MATSKFLRTFRTTQGVPITTAAIWLVPQANTYPTGALALTAHGTRDGQYYRDNVPDGEYKIYIDPAGGSSPTLYEEEIWIGDARITTISDHFDAADSHKLKTTGIKDAAITASLLATDAVETAKLKNANVTSVKLAQQTKTVVSVTDPTPDYIGQPGKDSFGTTYIAIALSGTMWQKHSVVDNVTLAQSVINGTIYIKDDGVNPDQMGAQSVTVVSSTSPVPGYLGQLGVDASGNVWIAISLTGTRWKRVTLEDGATIGRDVINQLKVIAVSGSIIDNDTIAKTKMMANSVGESQIEANAVTVAKMSGAIKDNFDSADSYRLKSTALQENPSLNAFNVVQDPFFNYGSMFWKDSFGLGGDLTFLNALTPISSGKQLFTETAAASTINGLWNYVPIISDMAVGETYKIKFLYRKSCPDNFGVTIGCVNSAKGSLSGGGDTGTLTTGEDEWVWTEEFTVTIQTGTAYFRIITHSIPIGETLEVAGVFCWKTGSVLSSISLKSVMIPQPSLVLYVDGTSGSDTNIGSSSLPFATINKALDEARIKNRSAKIIIKEGDYREGLGFNDIYDIDIELIAQTRNKVRILGSEALSSFSKTGGYTNIYEAAFSGTLVSYSNVLAEADSKNVIFEDGRPSKSITSSEVHPLQRGLISRLPYTALTNIAFTVDLATTLTALDSAPGQFYYDSSNNKIYIHSTDSDDPSSNGYSYEISQGPTNNANLTDFSVNLKMVGLQFLFSHIYGFISSGFNSVHREYCSVFGAKGTGWYDVGSKIISYKDEAGGCYVDGVAGEMDLSGYSTDSMRETFTSGIYFDLWSHDNGDNAISYHRRGEMTMYGGLLEYNGDGGAYPAYGTNATLYNVLSRKNTIFTATASCCGFASVGTADGGRANTKLVLFNCISEYNKYGFNCQSGNMMDASQCVARNSSAYDYAESGGSLLILRNCKGTTQTGTLDIRNDTDIT